MLFIVGQIFQLLYLKQVVAMTHESTSKYKTLAKREFGTDWWQDFSPMSFGNVTRMKVLDPLKQVSEKKSFELTFQIWAILKLRFYFNHFIS